jgi:hypothetical protein
MGSSAIQASSGKVRKSSPADFSIWGKNRESSETARRMETFDDVFMAAS